MISRLAVALVVVGGLLMAGSWGFPYWVDGRKGWSADDAVQLAATQAQLHRLRAQKGILLQKPQVEVDAAIAGRIDEQLEAAELRYKNLSGRLDAARDQGQTAAAVMRIAGLAIAAAGIGCFVAARARNS
jgi:hypothetical protein